MRRHPGFLWLVLLLSGAGAALRAFGQEAAAGRLILVSPHPEEIRREIATAFDAWHRERHGTAPVLDWRDVGGSSDAQRFVESEFAAKPQGIGIDLFFGGGPEPFLALADKRLLHRHPVPGLGGAELPVTANGYDIHAADGAWYGACLSSFGILQNLEVQRWAGLPRVTRWEQLADPRLFGWVGAGDPRNSGTMNNMFEAFLQAYGWERGWELLTAIAGNTRMFDRVSSSTAKEAALGQVAYAFYIDYYGFIQIEASGGGRLALVLPEDFTSVSPDGVAILKGAPEPALAGRFLEFLLSDAGQRLWLLPKGHPDGPRHQSLNRLPVRPGLYERYRGASAIDVNPFLLRSEFRYDATVARQRRDLVRHLFGAVLVDVHPELRAAWRAVIARGARPEEVRELGSVPLDEAAGRALLAGAWKQPGERNRLRNDWQRWARAKYRRLAALPAPTP